MIYHLGGQILYRSTTVLYNIFFVLSRFMPRRLWGDLFRPKLLKRPFFGLKDVYHFVVYNAYNTELYLQINAKMTLLLQITKFASQTASSWLLQPSYLSWWVWLDFRHDYRRHRKARRHMFTSNVAFFSLGWTFGSFGSSPQVLLMWDKLNWLNVFANYCHASCALERVCLTKKSII